MANKKYWVGLEELHQTPEFKEAQEREFVNQEETVDSFLGSEAASSASTSRRDFLKYMGFSLTAATLAACESPVIKSIPYVNKPEEIIPGVANYYASTYFDGYDFASVLVKTREGRPIYVKGNRQFGFGGGGVNARVVGSLLNLYNSERLQKPTKQGEEISWDTLDKDVKDALATAKNVKVLSKTSISPSTNALLKSFAESISGNVEFVNYDAISYSGIRKAHEITHGESLIPSYKFKKSKTIVGVGADFLGEWMVGNIFAAQYGKVRNPEGEWMAKHYQFEANMSLTGSNADHRIPVKPSQYGQVVVSIYNHLATLAGVAKVSGNTAELDGFTKKVADDLWKTRGESILVCGSNDVNTQVVVNAINNLLGNYEKTIYASKPMNIGKGDDAKVEALVKDLNSGSVDVLIISNDINPAYSLPNAEQFIAGLAKVKTSIAFSDFADETATRVTYAVPVNHYLESWDDNELKLGSYSLTQPTIRPVYDTRQMQESILAWMGSDKSYHDFIKENWEKSIYPKSGATSFFDFWHRSVQIGGYKLPDFDGLNVSFNSGLNLNQYANAAAKTSSADGFELVLYTKAGIGIGNHANNPWGQELPDPITKVTWDNYVTMAPMDVRELGLNEYLGERHPASVVNITVNGKVLSLPVVPSPGQKRGTLGVALGYGRGENGEKIGKASYQTGQYGDYLTDKDGKKVPIGKNAYPLVSYENGTYQYFATGVKVETTSETYPIAATQTHHTLMGRTSILKETDLATYKKGDVKKFNKPHTLVVHQDGQKIDKPVREINLWAEHPVENVGHRWGLTIDLTTCIGCGACVTACHSENNVPVVGKDEVRRSRDMHWLRIDRYYSSDEEPAYFQNKSGNGGDFSYDNMEVASENPSVVHMPMMCQHCNQAPCETVCPVAATTHSNEGLNQMTYNRCIGTRYCANNCPYKVRRFNWFNYMAYDKFNAANPSQDEMLRLVLNPDVTVRSRGVMEKCTMCVQRIQEGKLKAKSAGRPVIDGDVTTACSDACPTFALKIGDLNAKDSQVTKESENKRSYHALEEMGVKPNVYYMVKVRNTEENLA
ncbi:MAG: TAT-variant-translocated molybdopterin oxidoreductase [Luteibaculaceae bacterium]